MKQMKITRLELVNYTRMSLTGIRRFVFTPDDAYSLQTILGTNGCGKSSLQHELWFLPANQDDYGTNGSKDIEGEFNGHTYRLVSRFEGKPVHEFYVDGGDNLNEGGKIEMCRALCEEHLGVTNEIRSLALNREADRLTNMTPTRRRYWLVKLADTDFTYAMNVYKRLMEQHRDAQGTIKRLQKRLVDETNKLVEKDAVDLMIAETKDIKALIAEIYEKRDNSIEKPRVIKDRIAEIQSSLDDTMDDIGRFNLGQLQTSGYESIDQITQVREDTKLNIHSVQQVTQHLFADHQRVKKKYDMLAKAGTESIGELQAKLKEATEAIEWQQGFLVYKTIEPKHDPSAMHEALNSVYAELLDRLTGLTGNDGVFTQETASKAEEMLEAINTQIRSLQARMERLSADIDHRRSHVQQDSITCPNCQHNWTLKASENDLEKADKIVEKMKEDILALQAQAEANRKYLGEYNEYSTNYRGAVMIMKSVPLLAPYFNEICQNGRLMKYPTSVAHELHVVLSDLDHHVIIEKNKKIIAHCNEQIDLKKNLDADTLENIEKDLKRLEEDMSTRTRQLTQLQETLRETERLIQSYNTIVKLNAQLLAQKDELKQHVKLHGKSNYQALLWELILSLQTQLARKEDALSAAKAQQLIVDDIRKQLDITHMNERVAKSACHALSPTTGAIAEGLHRFINSFVMKMNKVINAIWTYPLEILPFEMNEGTGPDMDYKFPFMKKRQGKPAKDVVEGSESMVDVFNFAFRICAVRQLGLGYLPLFLDEFESAFDDIHRERAIYFVKKLLDEKAYGQIFMVSHYESNHGALSSLAQTCVLSKDNLLLPTNVVYNQHVEIS